MTRASDTTVSALARKSETSDETEQDQISQNIEAVLEFYAREELKITRSQRVLERVSLLMGQPGFIAAILLFVSAWMVSNGIMHWYGIPEFDPAPYIFLQGILGLSALLTATVVLTKQNRLAKLADQRAHLDLKVTLLTEQKAAKLIELIEELRRDLPNVKNRHDADATSLLHSMGPERVLAALDELGEAKVPQIVEEELVAATPGDDVSPPIAADAKPSTPT